MKKYILYLFCLVLIVNGCDKKQEPTIAVPIGKPTIESISPSAIVVGSDITIEGTNFNSDSTKISVLVDGQKCKINFIKSTAIIATLPANLIPGYKKVTIKQDDYIINSDSEFEVYAFPQSVTLESTTALIGDRVKITVNDLNQAFNCKVTGYINGQEVEAKRGSSFKEFFISINETGSVELRINSIPVKGVSLTIYEPGDLLTVHPWAIYKVDYYISYKGYTNNYEGIPGEFFFNKDGTYSRIERGVSTKGTWQLKRDPNYNDKYVIKFNQDLLTYQPYAIIEKLTLDSLFFQYSSNSIYKLIPSSNVPIAQPIPDLEMADIISRPKLWAINLNNELFGDEIRFLPNGNFIYHSLDPFQDFEQKGTWILDNPHLGKITLKISFPSDTLEFEVLKAEFDELKLKIYGQTGSYIPRYW